MSFNPLNKNVKQLKDFARKNKISGFSKLNKCELIILIQNFQQSKKTTIKKPKTKPKPPIPKISSKELLLKIKKRLQTKKFILEFSDEFGKDIDVLFDKARIFAVIVNQDLKKIAPQIIPKANIVVKNPTFAIISEKGNPEDSYYVFGNLDENLYRKDLVDKALRILKKPKILYKNKNNLIIRDDTFTILIALREAQTFGANEIAIPYSKYLLLRKIPLNQLIQKIPYQVVKRTDKVIREAFLTSKVLDRKILNIRRLARLLDYQFFESRWGDVSYLNDSRTNMLIDGRKITKETKESFGKLKRIKIDVSKIDPKKFFSKIDNTKNRYSGDALRVIHIIFKNPQIFTTESGLLIAKQNNIWFISAPTRTD